MILWDGHLCGAGITHYGDPPCIQGYRPKASCGVFRLCCIVDSWAVDPEQSVWQGVEGILRPIRPSLGWSSCPAWWEANACSALLIIITMLRRIIMGVWWDLSILHTVRHLRSNTTWLLCRDSANSDFLLWQNWRKNANQLSSYFMTLGIFALIATTLREASCRNLYSKQSALPKFMALTDLPCGIVTKAPH